MWPVTVIERKLTRWFVRIFRICDLSSLVVHLNDEAGIALLFTFIVTNVKKNLMDKYFKLFGSLLRILKDQTAFNWEQLSLHCTARVDQVWQSPSIYGLWCIVYSCKAYRLPVYYLSGILQSFTARLVIETTEGFSNNDTMIQEAEIFSPGCSTDL